MSWTVFGFDRIDVQFLFDFRTALLNLNQLVAERNRSSVPEPLTRIFPSSIGGRAWRFSLDWYSSNSAMTLRIIACTGSLSVADRLSDGDDP